MLLRACASESDDFDSACVRQPDGQWKTVTAKSATGAESASSVDVERGGIGALADGRAAVVAGLDRTTPLRIVVVDPAGAEEVAATIRMPEPSKGRLTVQSDVEQDASGALRLVIADDDGPCVVVARRGQPTAEAARVGAKVARLHGQHGIAVARDAVRMTRDGGATWVDAQPPPSVFAALRFIAASDISASELGATIGPVARLGWGPVARARDAPPSVAPTAPVIAAPGAASAAESWLACTTVGSAPKTAPPTPSDRPMLAPPPRLPPGVVAQNFSTTMDYGAALFGAEGVTLSTDGPLAAAKTASAGGPRGREPSGPARTWTFRWTDPRRVGASPRTATLRGPPPLVGAHVVGAQISGARALFRVEPASGAPPPDEHGWPTAWFVRVDAQGPPEAARFTDFPGMESPPVFGEGKGSPIAWMSSDRLIVWTSGAAPRNVAVVARMEALPSTRNPLLLGAPSSEGVPLILDLGDEARVKLLPLEGDGARVPVLGWATGPGFSSRRVKACAAGATGARVTVSSTGVMELDGVPLRTVASSITYRVGGGGDACVSSAAVRVAPDATHGASPVVRADFEARTFEAVDLPNKVRRLTCALR